PQQVALADVVRAKAMFDRVRVPTLGLVENMSYFVCDSCDKKHDLFATGGGERAAKDLDIPFLGGIPLEPAVRECGDAGIPLVDRAPDSASAQAFGTIASSLIARVEAAQVQTQKVEARRRSLPIIRT